MRDIHPPAHASQPEGNRLAQLMTLSTLAFVLAIWLDLTPLLRGPDEWRWTLRAVEQPLRLLAPVITLGLYTLVCARWLPNFNPPAGERRFLVFLTLAAPLIQLALSASTSRLPLLDFFGPTVSVHNSGYFSTAVATPNLSGLLTRYPALMPDLPIHAQSHPPGPIILHWLGWRFFENVPALADAVASPLRALQCHNVALMTLDNSQIASATIGMSIPLIGAFAVWPLYAFGKRVAGAHVAATSAAVFPVLPLFAMWPTQWDQVYPLLLFSGLYFAHTALDSGSIGKAFVAGIPLSLATFFSVGNAVLIAIIGLYSLTWLVVHRKNAEPSPRAAEEQPGGRRLWSRSIIAFALGCASIWLIYAALYRVNPLDVMAAGSRLAFESTTGQRSYGVWLIWNLIDFAIFFGAPLTILLFGNLAKARSVTLRASQGSSRDWLPLAIATIVSFIALDVSGSVRGEVGRLWMYFGPLLALVALAAIGQQATQGRGLLIGLMALQLMSMHARWLVNDSFLDEPPERQANFVMPNPQATTAATFDHQIALLGYDASLARAAEPSQGSLDLTLYWQALAQPPHAYTVFVHVLDASGRPIGQQDNMPLRDQLPTSCWQPGEVIADPYHLPLPADARGPLSIEVGFYRLDTGQRLTLDNGSGTSAVLTVP